MALPTSYRRGTMLLWLSATLIAIGPILGSPIGYLAVALVLGLLGMGFMRGKRWAAYIAFLIVGFFGAIALGWIWSIGGPPAWWAMATTATCWLTASVLFVALWHRREDANPT